MPETDVNARPLQDVGVLITRPTHQAGNLIRLVEQHGGVAIAFPTIEIGPPVDPGPLLVLLGRLSEFDLAIFVSPNAVEQTFVWLRTLRRTWPEGLPVACVGRASARALEELGIRGVVAPERRYDSEALLALPALQEMAKKRVVIFRGDGGRELLGDALIERGAEVVYAESYRRMRPQADATTLIDAWRQDEIHIVCITSTDGLSNLLEMLGDMGREWLLHTPIVTLSELQAAACRRFGLVDEVLIAPEASDEAILETIKTWRLGHFSL